MRELAARHAGALRALRWNRRPMNAQVLFRRRLQCYKEHRALKVGIGRGYGSQRTKSGAHAVLGEERLGYGRGPDLAPETASLAISTYALGALSCR